MSNITLATLRQKVAQELGAYEALTTTTAGETDGSTLICSTLAKYADNALKDKYIYGTFGTTPECRKIESNYSSEGVVHPYSVFSTTVATSKSFELHDLDPEIIERAINTVIIDAFPNLHKPLIDATLIAGNAIPNCSFEDWASSSYPDYWRTSVSTLTEDSTYKRNGSSSLKVVNAGYAYLSSNNYPALLALENTTIDFSCWALASAATAAYIEIYTVEQDGTATTTTCTTAHSGNGKWELLELENTDIPDDLAEIQFRCKVVGANTVYFDHAYCPSTPSEYIVPTSFTKVNRVYMCNSWDEIDVSDRATLDFDVQEREGVRYLILGDETAGNKLELVGYGQHADMDDDTDTIELSPQWQRIVIYAACSNLLRGYGSIVSSQDTASVQKLADRYEAMYQTLMSRNRMITGSYKIADFGR